MSEGRLVACSAPSFRHASFRDWRIQVDALGLADSVAYSRAISFSCILNDLQKRFGYLPFNFGCLELRTCQTFPTLPLRGSIELRRCNRCCGPVWIAGMDVFPIHRLTLFKYSQAVLGQTHRFAHFFLKGLK